MLLIAIVFIGCIGNARGALVTCKIGSSNQCRNPSGQCDNGGYCRGFSVNCPGSTLKANGTVCRASVGGCDVPEVCNGVNDQCPPDFNPPCKTATPSTKAPTTAKPSTAVPTTLSPPTTGRPSTAVPPTTHMPPTTKAPTTAVPPTPVPKTTAAPDVCPVRTNQGPWPSLSNASDLVGQYCGSVSINGSNFLYLCEFTPADGNVVQYDRVQMTVRTPPSPGQVPLGYPRADIVARSSIEFFSYCAAYLKGDASSLFYKSPYFMFVNQRLSFEPRTGSLSFTLAQVLGAGKTLDVTLSKGACGALPDPTNTLPFGSSPSTSHFCGIAQRSATESVALSLLFQARFWQNAQIPSQLTDLAITTLIKGSVAPPNSSVMFPTVQQFNAVGLITQGGSPFGPQFGTVLGYPSQLFANGKPFFDMSLQLIAELALNPTNGSFAVSLRQNLTSSFFSVELKGCTQPAASTYCGASADSRLSMVINISPTSGETTVNTWEFSSTGSGIPVNTQCIVPYLSIMPDGRVFVPYGLQTFSGLPPSDTCVNILSWTYNASGFIVSYKSPAQAGKVFSLLLTSSNCATPSALTHCGSVTKSTITTRTLLALQKSAAGGSSFDFSLLISQKNGAQAANATCWLSGTGVLVRGGYLVPLKLNTPVIPVTFPRTPPPPVFEGTPTPGKSLDAQVKVTTPWCLTQSASIISGNPFGIFTPLVSTSPASFMFGSLSSQTAVPITACSGLPRNGWHCGTYTFPAAPTDVTVSLNYSPLSTSFFASFGPAYLMYSVTGMLDVFDSATGEVVTTVSSMKSPFSSTVGSVLSISFTNKVFGVSNGSKSIASVTPQQCITPTRTEGTWCSSISTANALKQVKLSLRKNVVPFLNDTSYWLLYRQVLSDMNVSDRYYSGDINVPSDFQTASATGFLPIVLGNQTVGNTVFAVTSLTVSQAGVLLATVTTTINGTSSSQSYTLTDCIAPSSDLAGLYYASGFVVPIGRLKPPLIVSIPSNVTNSTIDFMHLSTPTTLYVNQTLQIGDRSIPIWLNEFTLEGGSIDPGNGMPLLIFGNTSLSNDSTVVIYANQSTGDITASVYFNSTKPPTRTTFSMVPFSVPSAGSQYCGFSKVDPTVFFAATVADHSPLIRAYSLTGNCYSSMWLTLPSQPPKGALQLFGAVTDRCMTNLTLSPSVTDPSGFNMSVVNPGNALEVVSLLSATCDPVPIPVGTYCGSEATGSIQWKVSITDDFLNGAVSNNPNLKSIDVLQNGVSRSMAGFIVQLNGGTRVFQYDTSLTRQFNFTRVAFNGATKIMTITIYNYTSALVGGKTVDQWTPVVLSLTMAQCSCADKYFRALDIVAGEGTAVIAPRTTFVETGASTAVTFGPLLRLSSTLSGALIISDVNNHCIRYTDPRGVVGTLAGKCGTPGSANGVGTQASFSSPGDVVVEKSTGNVFVADTGNNAIRMITSCGNVTTVQTGFLSPIGIAIHPTSGRLYISELHRVQIMQGNTGIVKPYIGGLTAGYVNANGLTAKLNTPGRVAFASDLAMYIPDTNNNCIRKVTVTGAVSTIAGLPSASGGFVDGKASTAQFQAPTELWISGGTKIYVIDSGNSVIRSINLTSLEVGTMTTVGSLNSNNSRIEFTNPTSFAVVIDGLAEFAADGPRVVRCIKP